MNYDPISDEDLEEIINLLKPNFSIKRNHIFAGAANVVHFSGDSTIWGWGTKYGQLINGSSENIYIDA